MDYRSIDDPRQLHTLVDAILTLEADADLSTLLRALVEQATALIGARYGALGIIADDGALLSEFITVGLTPDERAAIGPFPVGRGLLGRVVEDAEALRVSHLSQHPDRSGFPPNHPPMESFLGVPVRLGAGRVFGNLYLCEKIDGTPFSDADEALVDALGRVAGLLIDKAQLRLKLTALTLATERERMARDLHDTVIQRLFAVGLMLQGASNADLPAPVKATLVGAVDDLDETIRQIRTTIFAITSGAQESEPGARRRFLTLTDEVSQRLNLAVSVSFDGPVDSSLNQEVLEQALQVVREALTNVVRHAQASSAEVSVVVSPAGFTITVTDDGRGIDPNRTGTGRGLANLAARAADLGGWCTVSAGLKGGTVIEWHASKLSKEHG